MKHGIKILYLVLAVLIIAALWPQSVDHNNSKAGWDVQINDAGQLQVQGITLEVTTLNEAENILKSRSIRALFIEAAKEDEVKDPIIEAFFSNLPDNSKLVLGLNATKEQLDTISTKVHRPVAFPSGNIKLEIADDHMPLVDGMTVNSISMIPRIKIKPQDIIDQFGEPQQIINDDKALHHLYPKIGLDAILAPSGEAILQFVAPDQFHRVLDKLTMEPQTTPDR
jgi:hypothetical protein